MVATFEDLSQSESDDCLKQSNATTIMTLIKMMSMMIPHMTMIVVLIASVLTNNAINMTTMLETSIIVYDQVEYMILL